MQLVVFEPVIGRDPPGKLKLARLERSRSDRAVGQGRETGGNVYGAKRLSLCHGNWKMKRWVLVIVKEKLMVVDSKERMCI